MCGTSALVFYPYVEATQAVLFLLEQYSCPLLKAQERQS